MHSRRSRLATHIEWLQSCEAVYVHVTHISYPDRQRGLGRPKERPARSDCRSSAGFWFQFDGDRCNPRSGQGTHSGVFNLFHSRNDCSIPMVFSIA